MGPFPRACQPERSCTAGNHGTESTKSYRASGAVQLPAQHPTKSRVGGFFILIILIISLFFSRITSGTPAGTSLSFPLFLFGFSTPWRTMGVCDRVQPQRQVDEQSGRVWHKTDIGPKTEAQRREKLGALELDGPVHLFSDSPQSAHHCSRMEEKTETHSESNTYIIGLNTSCLIRPFYIQHCHEDRENGYKSSRPSAVDGDVESSHLDSAPLLEYTDWFPCNSVQLSFICCWRRSRKDSTCSKL